MGIVHPDAPGIYLAGVECDGATYHGSPAARDRDRVRQMILEDLGWNIVRLWSTDYFVNNERAIARLDAQLKKLLDASRNSRTSSGSVSTLKPTSLLSIFILSFLRPTVLSEHTQR